MMRVTTTSMGTAPQKGRKRGQREGVKFLREVKEGGEGGEGGERGEGGTDGEREGREEKAMTWSMNAGNYRPEKTSKSRNVRMFYR